jgi:FkbM family methyltransferase
VQPSFDVGAHIGSFALKTARLLGEGGLEVVLEPEIENYRIREENINRNSLENIVPLFMALSNFKGPCKAFPGSRNSGHSLSFPRSNEWQEVGINTIGRFDRRSQFRARLVLALH